MKHADLPWSEPRSRNDGAQSGARATYWRRVPSLCGSACVSLAGKCPPKGAILSGDRPPAFEERHVRAELRAWGLEGATVSPLPGGASGEVFLVATAEQRFVAKHAYMHRHDFEPGLLAADAVARATAFNAAAPLRTMAGDVLVMVEHNGYAHPLALLQLVQGEPVPVDNETAARELGYVLGTVQRVLTQVPSTALRIKEDSRGFLAYLRSTTQDLGEHQWLHPRIADIVSEIDGRLDAGTLLSAPGVWDGPERVRDANGGIGLIDFGNTGWYPVAHVVGYGTTQVRVADREAEARAIDAFIAAFIAEFPVATADLEAVKLFRLATVATYAKFMARRSATGQLPPTMQTGFARVLTELALRD